MVFSSLVFLCVFFPLQMIVYYFSKNIETKNSVLIIFSLAFYAWGEPSFIIILIIAGCYKKFRDSGIIKGCMSGLKPAVVGLIGASVISVGREVFIPDGLAVEIFKAAGTYVSAGILVIALILSFKKVHPIIIIILSAILGIAGGYIA